METRTDVTFVLAADDQPLIITHTHAGCVSLHLSSILTHGIGFCIQFLPAHLESVRDLAAHLAALEASLQDASTTTSA